MQEFSPNNESYFCVYWDPLDKWGFAGIHP